MSDGQGVHPTCSRLPLASAPPVPGPGAAYSPGLWRRGFADSKTLTQDRREALLRALEAAPRLVGAPDSLSAAYISGRMLAGEKASLNALAFASTCSLIERALEAGVNLQEVYVDTVGDAARHREALSQARRVGGWVGGGGGQSPAWLQRGARRTPPSPPCMPPGHGGPPGRHDLLPPWSRSSRAYPSPFAPKLMRCSP